MSNCAVVNLREKDARINCEQLPLLDRLETDCTAPFDDLNCVKAKLVLLVGDIDFDFAQGKTVTLPETTSLVIDRGNQEVADLPSC